VKVVNQRQGADKTNAKGAEYESAPKARNMIARGKREARRPWISVKEKGAALKGRNTAASISAFQASTILLNSNQGRRARFARACPWLSYFAPLALSRTYL
jgi:hypothetical protein